MVDDLITILKNDVYEKCSSTNNRFGMGIYYHIEAVVKNATLLAKRYGGDIEVVAIAAWLHDYASITDYKYYDEHHVWGAKMARDILKKHNYPEFKIKLVQKCILNHRGSIESVRTTIEEQCVCDGDAISHFDSIPSLFYLVYVRHGMSIEEGKEYILGKLERSYKKLSTNSKMIYKDKYTKAIVCINGE